VRVYSSGWASWLIKEIHRYCTCCWKSNGTIAFITDNGKSKGTWIRFGRTTFVFDINLNYISAKECVIGCFRNSDSFGNRVNCNDILKSSRGTNREAKSGLNSTTISLTVIETIIEWLDCVVCRSYYTMSNVSQICEYQISITWICGANINPK
jgi:hypothetical protein